MKVVTDTIIDQIQRAINAEGRMAGRKIIYIVLGDDDWREFEEWFPAHPLGSPGATHGPYNVNGVLIIPERQERDLRRELGIVPLVEKVIEP